MKYFLFSIITSILSGLVLYWSYLVLVTGLSLVGLVIVEFFWVGLLLLSGNFIKKSNHKKLGLAGFLLFGLLLPCALIVGKKWHIDKKYIRRYQNTSVTGEIVNKASRHL